jgi:hypothetical protein
MQPRCPGHSWGQIWCPKNMPKTHTHKQRKWNYFPFGLSQESGAALICKA